LKIDIITLFPDAFFGPFAESIIGRARKQKLVEINTVDLRSFAHDSRGTVDDKIYGGGPGMLMKPEPVFEAVESVACDDSIIILTSPQGKNFSQKEALGLRDARHIVFVCGHYEGVDERIRRGLVNREYSIGDYVLTNGNLPAMVITDAIVRLVPGVLGAEESRDEESFSDGLLEYPQYTRPPEFRGMRVPEVLLSGDHGRIKEWRAEKALERTRRRRPDLLGGNL
jgi:tRNA (guanine37-N1)-methyltransferase